jgi:hypothetical protein
MRWTVPEPEDGRMRDTLPFTVTRHTARGCLLYLRDFMEAHRGGVVGRFTTDEVVVEPPENADDLPELRGTVWLAPYDLGVRQDFTVRFVPSEDEAVCGIEIVLEHRTGQPANWSRLNRTFLGRLRRQLLGWRNLKTSKVLKYIQAAEG